MDRQMDIWMDGQIDGYITLLFLAFPNPLRFQMTTKYFKFFHNTIYVTGSNSGKRQTMRGQQIMVSFPGGPHTSYYQTELQKKGNGLCELVKFQAEYSHAVGQVIYYNIAE